MSWSSRFGNWASGPWSPFGRSSSGKVSDEDYSYITSQDLDEHVPHHVHHTSSHGHGHQRRRSHLSESRPVRDTDVLIFRYKKISYPVHFPAYSIDDGELSLGRARDQIASRLDVDDPSRVRMFFKGKNLKDDRVLCRDVGLRSDVESEILCIVGDRTEDSELGADSGSESTEDSYVSRDGSDIHKSGSTKKKKRRSRKKKSKGISEPDGATGGAQYSTVEHLPVPSGSHPLHKAQTHTDQQTPSGSRGQSPARPGTPMAKLDSIAANYHTTLLPQCESFISSPPAESAKREYEHKRLTETVLSQVLLKLDGVDSEGDEEARNRRKALVKEVQGMLSRLDDVMKG